MVKQWVKRALETSGLIRPYYRWRERRRSRQPVDSLDDGLPMPPGNLITLVNGVPDPVWFGTAAKRTHQNFWRWLRGMVSIGSCSQCPGSWMRLRTNRALDGSAPPGVFHGSDINSDLVSWCKAHLPGRYFLNELAPPLDIAAASLDLVYAHSVLTHLTEMSVSAWLKEMKRVLKDGGWQS